MLHRKLGRTGIDVSELMLGAWAYGHDAWEGRGPVDDSESIATINAALDAGVNWIDTAAGYGAGYSERIVGRAVASRRDEVLLASKCWSDPDSIRRTIDECLTNMGTDRIDLYQVHYPSSRVPIAETIGAMKEIQEAGKIRFIGISNFSVEQHREALATARIETSQPPFNILWRQPEDDVIPFCIENDISVIPYSPLAQGLLAGRYRSSADVPDDIRARNKLLAAGTLERCLEVVDRLDEIARAHGKTLAQAAIAWTLAVPGITAPIVGARNRTQLQENLGGLGWRLTDEEFEEISAMGRRVSDTLDFSSNMWGWTPP